MRVNVNGFIDRWGRTSGGMRGYDWCCSPPRLWDFTQPLLCLAFSPGKGSFTVIETPLPQALYTHTRTHKHSHRHTQALALSALCPAGWGICHFWFIFMLLYFCLCVCDFVLQYVCLSVCVHDCVSMSSPYTKCVHASLCISVFESLCPVYLCHSIFVEVLYTPVSLWNFCKTLHMCVCAVCMCSVYVRWQSSLKVRYEKMRERRRRQEMNGGVEMETWDGQTSPGGGAGCLGAMSCHSRQE